MLRRVQDLSGKYAAMVVVETGDALGTRTAGQVGGEDHDQYESLHVSGSDLTTSFSASIVSFPRGVCCFRYCCFGAAGGLAAGAVVSSGAVFFVLVLVFDLVFFFGVVGSAAGA